MKKEYLFVEIIPRCFTRNDCVQVMIPFTKSITIYDKDTFMEKDIICRYSTDGSDNVINEYLDDSRRHDFPYSDIPLFCSRKGLKKVYYVNQLFEYDTDYWYLVDLAGCHDYAYDIAFNHGYFVHCYLLEDYNDVLLVSQYYDSDVYGEYDSIKCDTGFKKYTIEEIKGLSPVKVREARIPRCSYMLNPNIDRKEIKNAKKRVKSFKER